jgi:hypothetical protein
MMLNQWTKLVRLDERIEFCQYTATWLYEDERVRVITLTPAGVELKDQALKVPVEMFCLCKMNKEELTLLKT